MLDKYRAEIDQIDQQIIELLDKRFDITKQVGEYKAKNNIPVLNQAREDVIINKLKNMELNHEQQIIDLYIALMDISKGQQDD